MPIYVICDYYIDTTDLADLSSFQQNLDIFVANIKISSFFLPLESGNLQLELTQFPVFSLTGNFFGHFPCFPCAVGTLKPRDLQGSRGFSEGRNLSMRTSHDTQNTMGCKGPFF